MNPQYGDVHPCPRKTYFFKEDYDSEDDAFAKYYRNICSNGYILTILEEVENLGDFCDLYANVSEDSRHQLLNLFYEPFSDHEKNDSLHFATQHVQLRESKEKGRHLVAASNISRNTALINEVPTVLQVAPLCKCVGDGRTSLYRCHHCGIACTHFYTCDSCNVCIFCSRKCLTTACKSYHAFECFGLQRHFWSMDDTDYSYISLRMMLYGATKNFDTRCYGTCYGSEDNNYPFIYRLETHFDDMPKSKINKILYSSARNLVYLQRTSFFKYIKSKTNIDDLYLYVGGLMVKHYCQAQINNIILKYPNMTIASGLNISSGSGKAICPTISLINHSCSPNATILICSNYLVVKSIKQIRIGEEITLCYAEINAFFNKPDRSIITEEILFFTCECQLCISEEASIDAPYKCPLCLTGNAKLIQSKNNKELGSCTNCLKHFPMDWITKHLKRAAKYKTAYSTSFSIDSLAKLADCYVQIFPPNAYALLEIYRTLYEKHLLWGEKPIEIIKYGLLIFQTLENGLCSLYIPLLSAKIMFMAKLVDVKTFTEVKIVNLEEFETAKQFVTEVIKMKKDLLFYLPEERLQYYKYIQTRVHKFFENIRVQE